MKLILDTYGADAGTAPIIEGALQSLYKHPELRLVLVGNEEEIHTALSGKFALEDGSEQNACDYAPRIEVIHTTDYITNHEPAMCIFNGRNESSTALALGALKEQEDILGMLTAGNTGATLVGSIFRLGLHKGLKSPALSSQLPQVTGGYAVLVDCGANTDCTVKDLVNFATLGSDFARQMYHLEKPRVALLNVGKEPGKGNPLAIEAFQALSAREDLNFIGNIEGCDISLGKTDVIVCDGFSGNIVLKEVEATGKIAMKILENTAKANGTLEDPTVKAALSQMYTMFEMNTRGGATFLGTKKPIIKMHGVAEAQTVVACVDQMIQFYS